MLLTINNRDKIKADNDECRGGYENENHLKETRGGEQVGRPKPLGFGKKKSLWLGLSVMKSRGEVKGFKNLVTWGSIRIRKGPGIRGRNEIAKLFQCRGTSPKVKWVILSEEFVLRIPLGDFGSRENNKKKTREWGVRGWGMGRTRKLPYPRGGDSGAREN